MPKATNAERDQRVEVTRQLLGKGKRKGEIKRALKQAYGISARQCERYIAWARAEVIQAIGRSVDELRSEAYETYLAVIEDKTSTPMARIKAQTAIDKLLGLCKPSKVEISGNASADGVKVVLTLPDNKREPAVTARYREQMLKDAKARTNGNGNGKHN